MLSGSHLGKALKFKGLVIPNLYFSYPAHAIIAPLSVHSSAGGIKAIFFLSKGIAFFEQYIERGKYYPNRMKRAISKNNHNLLKREEVNLKRRFISHVGFIYKVTKEFFKAFRKLKLVKIQQFYF